MSFNINKLKVSDTAVLHLKNPATDEALYADEKEKQPVTIEVYSKGSKAYRNALAEVSRKAVQRKGKQQSLETSMEDNVNFLATISKVAANMDMDGVAIDSAESFKKLYATPELFWIRDQVDAFIQETGSFLPS